VPVAELLPPEPVGAEDDEVTVTTRPTSSLVLEPVAESERAAFLRARQLARARQMSTTYRVMARVLYETAGGGTVARDQWRVACRAHLDLDGARRKVFLRGVAALLERGLVQETTVAGEARYSCTAALIEFLREEDRRGRSPATGGKP
jgi:hypothetical protein